MKTTNLYTAMQESLLLPLEGFEFFDTNPAIHFLREIARSWNLDQNAIREWLLSPEALRKRTTAEAYLKIAKAVVRKVESVFGRELPGELVLMPSFGDFDGFARYELGKHFVLLGVDFPDADVEYLKALTAHELSHVFRDHATEVWSHLGKPLNEISRKEYLDAGTAGEHLVSEGLATLFSQVVYPEIPPSVHHFYEASEWKWCMDHDEQIDRAIIACLQGDENVWSFYGSSSAGAGSPSRTQYYWAAKKIRALIDFELLRKADTEEKRRAMQVAEIVRLHTIPASRYPIFNLKPGSP